MWKLEELIHSDVGEVARGEQGDSRWREIAQGGDYLEFTAEVAFRGLA